MAAHTGVALGGERQDHAHHLYRSQERQTLHHADQLLSGNRHGNGLHPVALVEELLRWRTRSLRLKGKTVTGTAETVVDDTDTIAAALTKHLKNNKMDGKYYGVTYDENGDPDPEKIRKGAEEAIMIRVTLN
jgi:hypothetical protein